MAKKRKTTKRTYLNPDEAWVIHREDIDTVIDGDCHIYFLLDAYSAFCFGQELGKDIPSAAVCEKLLKDANLQARRWPKEILISKKDPLAETVLKVADNLKLHAEALPPSELAHLVAPLKKSFANFKMGNMAPPEMDLEDLEEEEIFLEEFLADEQEELEAMLPDPFDPCPCASGKKYKTCCRPIFREITNAMASSEQGFLDDALNFMELAKEKVGLTAEVLCRYGICWSFEDPEKAEDYLRRALKKNPKHPRSNYIFGIISKENGNLDESVKFYKKAIENYPVEDKYHINEALSNLGTVYYDKGDYQQAKDTWEKALVTFPDDMVARNNLYEFIYDNEKLPKELRKVSPFIENFLEM